MKICYHGKSDENKRLFRKDKEDIYLWQRRTKVAMDEALKCKETGEEKTIVFGLTGTGYFDMVAYGKYNDGQMSDYIPTDEDLAKGFATIPNIPELNQ